MEARRRWPARAHKADWLCDVGKSRYLSRPPCSACIYSDCGDTPPTKTLRGESALGVPGGLPRAFGKARRRKCSGETRRGPSVRGSGVARPGVRPAGAARGLVPYAVLRMEPAPLSRSTSGMVPGGGAPLGPPGREPQSARPGVPRGSGISPREARCHQAALQQRHSVSHGPAARRRPPPAVTHRAGTCHLLPPEPTGLAGGGGWGALSVPQAPLPARTPCTTGCPPPRLLP